MVHSLEDYYTAVEASEILFGKGTAESLSKLKETDFLSIFEGVPQNIIDKSIIEKNPTIIDLLCTETNVLPSKS
ncbi:MAG TPA: tyrosine--tRNA ligase, partial [Spirochaetota bacterium]|nr:tyrosine--tRNA ligase [Spirochaetota bacterium]